MLTELWVFIFLSLLLLWLSGVTFWLYKVSGHYSRLTKNTNARDLREILEQLLSKEGDLEKGLGNVKQKVEEYRRQSVYNIQKVGVVRFNSFGDTGGDQSFAMALLDGRDSGLVILGLHGRDTTRVYMKDVKGGVSSDHGLSKEEAQAVERARKAA